MENSNFLSTSQETLFNEVLDRMRNFTFEEEKKIDADQQRPLAIYKMQWFKQRLNALESFDEGEFTFAGRIKINRWHTLSSTHPDPTFHDFVTKIEDVTITNKRGSVCVVHGFA